MLSMGTHIHPLNDVPHRPTEILQVWKKELKIKSDKVMRRRLPSRHLPHQQRPGQTLPSRADMRLTVVSKRAPERTIKHDAQHHTNIEKGHEKTWINIPLTAHVQDAVSVQVDISTRSAEICQLNRHESCRNRKRVLWHLICTQSRRHNHGRNVKLPWCQTPQIVTHSNVTKKLSAEPRWMSPPALNNSSMTYDKTQWTTP